MLEPYLTFYWRLVDRELETLLLSIISHYYKGCYATYFLYSFLFTGIV